MEPEEMEELRETFEHFDSDGNGVIDAGEFRGLLNALGAGMSDEEAAVGFEMIDQDGNGKIEFSEFVGWWSADR